VRHDARRHTYTKRFMWYSHCISRDAKALLVYIQSANHKMYVGCIMRRNALFGVFHTNSAGARFIQNFRTQKNQQKTSHPISTAKSRIWGTETAEPIDTKFCMPGAVQDVITPASF